MRMENHTIPSAPQFEKTVLGAIINDSGTLPEVIGFLTPECFYEPVNAKIFGVLRQMYDANEQIDLYTVGKRCAAIDGLNGMKTTAYVAQCTQSIGTGAHIMSHAQALKEAYIRRTILTEAHKLIAKAVDNTEDLADTLSYISRISDTSNEIAAGGSMSCHLSKSLSDSLKQAERRQQLHQSGRVSGTTTGLVDLDSLTGGWQASQLIILAARPAMGKTALMLHLAKAAARAGVPVCIYSLEMSDVSLANRLILSECSVEADAFRSGNLTPFDWAKLEQAVGVLEHLPIYVDDNPMVSMRYIKAHSKIMQRRGQCGLILVDYLQLADTSTDQRNRNREQEIAQASRQAKIIAKELAVPFILLSQLSRECEKRADKTPQLSDLRESGAIEQDADIVSFIYRPAYYGQENITTHSYGEISTAGLGILSIAKQRDGATGMVIFQHNPAMTKLRTMPVRKQAIRIGRFSEPNNPKPLPAVKSVGR